MWQYSCACGIEVSDNSISSMCRRSVVLQPPVLSPPQLVPFSPHVVTQVSHHLQVDMPSNSESTLKKLSHDHSLRIPEHHHHALAHTDFTSDLLRAGFIPGQP